MAAAAKSNAKSNTNARSGKAKSSAGGTRSTSKKSSTGSSNSRSGSSKSTVKKTNTTRKSSSGRNASVMDDEEYRISPARIKEIYFLVFLALNVILMLGTFGLCGKAGRVVSGFFFGLFGATYYILPVFFVVALGLIAANTGRKNALRKAIVKTVWVFAAFMVAGFILQLSRGLKDQTISTLYMDGYKEFKGGGVIFGGIIVLVGKVIGKVGAIVVTALMAIITVIMVTEKSVIRFLKTVFEAGFTPVNDDDDDRDYQDGYYQDDDDDDLLLDDDFVQATNSKSGSFANMKVYDQTKVKDEKAEVKKLAKKAADGKLRKKNAVIANEEMRELIPEEESVLDADIPAAASNSYVSENTEEKTKKKKKKRLDIATEKIALPGEKLPDRYNSYENRKKRRAAIDKKLSDVDADINTTEDDTEEGPKDFFNISPDIATYDDPLGSDTHYDSQSAKVSHASVLTESEKKIFDEAENSMPDVSYEQNDDIFGSDEEAFASNEDNFASNEDNFAANDDIFGNDYQDYDELQVEEDVFSATPDPMDKLTKVTGSVQRESRPVKTEVRSSAANMQALAAGAGSVERKTPLTEDKVTKEDKLRETEEVASEIQNEEVAPKKEYVFPPVSLLKSGGNTFMKNDKHVRETAMKLKSTLESFGVNVTITDYSCGPAVTRYELQPEQGVKVNKILGLANDIKLNLAAEDIRIEAPIPGKAAIGIEVPNKEKQAVYFRDLIDNDTFRKFKSDVAFAVGKDISGQIVITDIAKMPHLLIAGQTGAGKSVCINTLIMSILYKAKPEDVRLIMIDPKMVELSVYNGIPHLLIPVVTDPKKAAGALNWAVGEMTRRYSAFSKHGVRNIEGYNKKVAKLGPQEDDPTFVHMSQIIIIIDELSDLMMAAHKEVEDSIVRISQLARAAGIYLVIATQRPSVDVITGLIKANVPSRIACKVASQIDSRTILDVAGAEKLLGKGDMLFYPTGSPKPSRVQGAYIDDDEVAEITEFIKENYGEPIYDNKVSDSIVSASQSSASNEVDDSDAERYDELFEDAGRLVIEKDKASIGLLQRFFRIGFNRAARIMDQLAEEGVVGPEEGTKPRRILMSIEEFDRIFD